MAVEQRSEQDNLAIKNFMEDARGAVMVPWRDGFVNKTVVDQNDPGMKDIEAQMEAMKDQGILPENHPGGIEGVMAAYGKFEVERYAAMDPEALKTQFIKEAHQLASYAKDDFANQIDLDRKLPNVQRMMVAMKQNGMISEGASNNIEGIRATLESLSRPEPALQAAAPVAPAAAPTAPETQAPAAPANPEVHAPQPAPAAPEGQPPEAPETQPPQPAPAAVEAQAPQAPEADKGYAFTKMRKGEWVMQEPDGSKTILGVLTLRRAMDDMGFSGEQKAAATRLETGQSLHVPAGDDGAPDVATSKVITPEGHRQDAPPPELASGAPASEASGGTTYSVEQQGRDGIKVTDLSTGEEHRITLRGTLEGKPGLGQFGFSKKDLQEINTLHVGDTMKIAVNSPPPPQEFGPTSTYKDVPGPGEPATFPGPGDDVRIIHAPKGYDGGPTEADIADWYRKSAEELAASGRGSVQQQAPEVAVEENAGPNVEDAVEIYGSTTFPENEGVQRQAPEVQAGYNETDFGKVIEDIGSTTFPGPEDVQSAPEVPDEMYSSHSTNPDIAAAEPPEAVAINDVPSTPQAEIAPEPVIPEALAINDVPPAPPELPTEPELDTTEVGDVPSVAELDASAPETYKIQPRDTLSEIAMEHGTTVEELMAANEQIVDRDKIYAGDTLILPETSPEMTDDAMVASAETHIVEKDEILSGDDATVEELAELNGIDDPDMIFAGGELILQQGGDEPIADALLADNDVAVEIVNPVIEIPDNNPAMSAELTGQSFTA